MLNAIGIGEVLWDVFPDGRKLGGAPFNFAYHVNSLGGSGAVVSRVGTGELGCEIIARCGELGMDAAHIQVDPVCPTGTVDVTVNPAGVPDFIIHDDVAWDRIEMTPDLEELAPTVDTVCFGTLAQRDERSRSAILGFLELTEGGGGGARKIFDVNLRQSFYTKEVIETSLQLADVVKLNAAELQVVAGVAGLAAGGDMDSLSELVKRYDLEMAALTLGAAGCVLVSPGGSVTAPVADLELEVVDTVGSGDAFTAALALGLAEKMLPDKLAAFCNLAGSYVASHPGATPDIDRESLESFGLSLE